VSAPDHENPADANADNVYEVTVQASDGSLADSQALAVSVSGVNEAPTASLPVPARVAENAPNGSPVAAVSASDPDVGDVLSSRWSTARGAASRSMRQPVSWWSPTAPGSISRPHRCNT